MDKPNLIIFKFKGLYQILKELEEFLNFKVIEVTNEKNLEEIRITSKNFFIVSQKGDESLDLQLVLHKFPIKISKLLEKVNIQLIKSQFNQKSDLYIGQYKLDLNSRELIKESINLKLTEKEANIIVYLYNSKIPIGIDKLQSEVWGYKSELETHTVETHIYRLRKKLLQNFNDNNFIRSKKNGYQII
tara:strand:- start:1060 stop:1623 length:564 start_codon:yes stop_codon:yes gene_type:complete